MFFNTTATELQVTSSLQKEKLEAGVWKEEIKDVALGMMPHGLGRRNPSKRNWPKKMGQRQDTGQSMHALLLACF